MRRVDVLRGWRQRWAGPAARAAARQLTRELLAGDLRTSSPFGEVDGRADLRGLQVDLLAASCDPMYQRVGVDGGSWTGLDLTGAGLSGMNWTHLQVSDCVLVDAQLDQLRCWGVSVSDCLAQRAAHRDAQIGASAGSGFSQSSWQRTDLRGADLRHLHGSAVFEDVDLRSARFGPTDFGWSHLVRVRFSGMVTGLSIGGLKVEDRPHRWRLHGVDLTEARLDQLRLNGVDLGSPGVDLRLPEDEDQWVIRDWSQYLDRLQARALADLEADVRIWTDVERRHLGPHQTLGFTTYADAPTSPATPSQTSCATLDEFRPAA